MKDYSTFNDYAEMCKQLAIYKVVFQLPHFPLAALFSATAVIQFGYVTFFSWAFPLAPALALLNNIVETRTDARKILHHSRRPIAHKAGGIGEPLWTACSSLLFMVASLALAMAL